MGAPFGIRITAIGSVIGSSIAAWANDAASNSVNVANIARQIRPLMLRRVPAGTVPRTGQGFTRPYQ